MKKITLSLLLFAITCFTFGQTTVTKSYLGPTVTVDGCGSYCVALPSVTFVAGDFTPGCTTIIDVDVSIDWIKTDGSCAAPGAGCSFHNETNFRIDGPAAMEILATPSTWTGCTSTPVVTTVFDQAAGGPPGPGDPISGTFQPNGGNLDNFNGLSALGAWNLAAGDTAGLDPLCVVAYSVTITVGEPNDLCVNAITIDPVTGGTVSGDTTCATFDAAPFCGTSNTTNGVWYTFTDTTGTGMVVDVNTCSAATTYDSKLSVYTGTCGAPVCVGGNDDDFTCAFGILDSRVGFATDGSSTYNVLVHGFSSSTGPFDLNYSACIIDITCPADVVTVADPGVCDATGVALGTPTTNSCPGEIITNDAPGSFPVGVTVVTWTVTDASGTAVATCTQNVTVNDTQNPIIGCPADITVNNDPGVCGATVGYGIAFSDNCPGAVLSQTAGQASGTVFPVGTTTNTFVVTDASGNTATCSFDVIVNDTEPPVITCPADIIVSNDPGSCDAVVTYTVTATDNCPGETIAQTAGLPSGSAFPVGTTTNTFMVTDASGNTDTCSFDVTVNDTEDPVITCPADIVVSNDPGLCSAVVNYTVTATDNCGIPGPPVEYISNGDFEIGSIAGWTAVTGGSSAFVMNDGTPVPPGPGLATAPINGGFDLLTQQSGPSSQMISQPIVVPTGVAASTVSWNDRIRNHNAVYDDPNQEFKVEILDAAMLPIQEIFSTNPGDPLIQMGPNARSFDLTALLQTLEGQTVYLSFFQSTQLFFFNVNLDDISLTIQTGLAITQTAGLPSGSAFPVGTTTNTFVATDAAGNTDTCSFDVTVNDTEPPVAVCATGPALNPTALGVPLGQPIPATGTSGPMDPSVATVSESGIIGTDFNLDTVELDLNHTFDGDLDITLMSPLGTMLPLSHDNGGSGNDYIGTIFQDGGADINAAGAPFTGTFQAEGGTFAAAFGGEDINGPWSLLINDQFGGDSGFLNNFRVNFMGLNPGPVQVFLDATGNASITVADIDGGSTDNCGIASMSIDITDFTCADIGINVVTLTVTDIYGNVSTCTSDVLVIDNIPPVAVCQDITVQLDANGMASITADQLDGGSTDNCAITFSASQTDFDCSDVGVVVVTLTVTDEGGNTDTCTANVTVEDNIPPTIVCPADITVNNDPGLCSAVVDYEAGSASIIFSEFFPTGSGDPNCGAWATFESQLLAGLNYQSVTMSGDNDPVGITMSDPVMVGQLADALRTNSSITLVDGPNTWRVGGCGPNVELSVNQSICFCDNPGYSIRPCLSNGNWGGINGATCGAPSQTMTVEFVHAVGGGPIVGMDNCPGSTTVQTAGLPSGSAFPVGTTTNTFVVTDASGNTATCSFDVTVVDNEPPTIVCPSDISVDTDPGECSAVVFFPDAIAIDNCGVMMVVQTGGLPSGSAFPVGVNVVEYTATDVNGNTAVCTFTITVTDNEDPVAICQDITVELDANGEYVLTPGEIDNGSSDNCGIVSYEFQVLPVQACGPSGLLIPETGTSGPMLPSPANVTEVGVVGVDFTIASVDLDLNHTFDGDLDITLTSPMGTVLVLADQLGGSGDNYTDTVFADGNPNITTGAAPFTGTFEPQGGTLNGTFAGESVTGDWTLNIFDNFGGDSGVLNNYCINLLPVGGVSSLTLDCDDVGVNIITLIVTDAQGNTDTCESMVTVEDNIAPIIVCIGEQVTGPNTESDSPGTAILDNTTVSTTITVPDSFTITDLNIDLDITHTWVGDLQITLESPASTQVLIFDGGADGCSGDNIVDLYDDESGNPLACMTGADAFPLADYIPSNALSAFDGEDSAGVWTLFVEDTAGGDQGTINSWSIIYDFPPIVATPLEVDLDANGMATIDASDLLLSVDEACGWTATVAGVGPPVSLETTFAGGNGNFGNMFDMNALSDVTIESFDIHGDTGATFDVEVYAKLGTYVGFETDPGAWTLIGTAPGVVSNGDGVATPLDLMLGYDMTAGETHGFYVTPTDFSTGGFNYTNGTGVGNVFASDANIEFLEGSGSGYPFNGTLFSPRVWNGNIIYTAGGGMSTTIDFTCDDLGENLIEVTVTDDSGNVATCTATVNVNDVTPPVLVCMDVTVELDENGIYVIDPEELLAQMPSTYEVITISSDNQSGAPGETDFTVPVTAADNVSFDWSYSTMDGAAFDSFGYLLNGVFTEVIDPGGANNQMGTTGPIAVAPGDVFGFRSSSTDGLFGPSTTVISNFIPGFTGQFDPANWTLTLNNSDGDAFFVEIPGGPLSFDACGIEILAVDITEVTCDDIGTPVVITVFAADSSLNIAVCQSTVTVVDLLPPVVTCPPDQTVDPGPGNLFWEVEDYFALGEASATDNCTDPLTLLSQDPAPGTLLIDGVYTITMIAEDEYGNIGTCTFELTVESVLGVDDFDVDISTIVMYPNPATDVVNISNPQSIELEQAAIYDVTGRLIQTYDLRDMGTEQALDISQLSTATYLVVIQGQGGGQITKQLIKE